MNDYGDEQWNEMVDLLTYVAAADRRTIGDTDIQVWLDGAADGEWPSMRAAYRAVRVHRREQPGKWLEPGHVTAILDRVRRAASADFNQHKLDPPREVMDDADKYAEWVQATAKSHQTRAMDRFVAGERAPARAIEAAS